MYRGLDERLFRLFVAGKLIFPSGGSKREEAIVSRILCCCSKGERIFKEDDVSWRNVFNRARARRFERN